MTISEALDFCKRAQTVQYRGVTLEIQKELPTVRVLPDKERAEMQPLGIEEVEKTERCKIYKVKMFDGKRYLKKYDDCILDPYTVPLEYIRTGFVAVER